MNTSSVILAFGFGHLAMLGWLAAAAAPLLIHLWNRRKHREVEWAAIEWLLAALRKNSRRIQIEQWILLAVRTLLIVLVVLAFAEPYLERLGIHLAGGHRRHRLIAIDGSFSMAAIEGEQTLFEQAKEVARRIVDHGAEGDAFTLVLLSNPPRAVVGTPAFDPADFLEELDSLKLPHGGMDLPAAMTQIEEILRRARRDHPRLGEHEVYFLTDLQRAGWMPEVNNTRKAEYLQLAERVASAARLRVVDLGRPLDNLAISAVRTIDTAGVVGQEVTAEVDLKNFSRQPQAGQKIELLVDGRQAGEEIVEVAGEGQATARFRYAFDAPGEHALEARIAGDKLDVDNHRWLALPIKPSLSVLCVNGKPGGGDFEQATDYLTVALTPEGDDAAASVRSEVIRESGLVERDLAEYDCVFLCNVGQFTAGEARLLDAYVRRGGGLVIFLGDQAQAASYNRFLGGEEPGLARILPARLGAVAAEADYRIDPLGYRHALVEVFRDQEQSGLLSTPIRRYVRLSAIEGSAAHTALAVSGGDPIVVEESFGRGRVLLVATSADTSWNMMPVLPSYVPLVHELLKAAISGQASQRNLEVGQAIADDTAGAAQSAPTAVETPGGERQAIRLGGDGRGWQFGDTWQSGLYRVEFDGGDARLFAVNVDPRESDLARLSEEELRQEVWPGVDFDHLTSWSDPSRIASGGAARRGDLNQMLIYAALALALLEPLLAWRFGHHRA
jgi:hypothetical protein